MADISRMAVSASGEDTLRPQLIQVNQLPPLPGEGQTAIAIAEPDPAAEQEQQNAALSQEEQDRLQETIASLDAWIKPLSIGLNVQRLESIDRWYVQVLDRETGEVIKEIPPRRILQMQENMRAMQGLLFDKFS